jgi:thiamine transport system ATP-binding protein
MRRSALRVDPAGTLHGRVLSARSTPDAVRLTVDVEDVGEVHAVAAVADGATVLGVGNDIRLAVDLSRTARLAAQNL